MPYDGLADFLEAIETAGQLARIDVEVDPCGELMEVARRALGDKIDAPSPVLLFSRVAGHDWPVVVNRFDSAARLAEALKAESCDELVERLVHSDQAATPPGFFDRLKRIGSSSKPTSAGGPKFVKTARCQQVVELGRDIDLSSLPVPRVGIDGERAAITAGTLIAREPGSASITSINAPLVVLDKNQLGLVWHPVSELARYYALARQRGEALPVAIALAACPTWEILGEAPLPPGVEAMAYAAAIRGAPLELVKARTQPIDVPADAEIVLEGSIDTSAAFVPLGVFVTPLGHVAPQLMGPAIEITAITHRANPVLPVRATGWPWRESAVLRQTGLRLVLPAARQFVPGLVDYDAPLAGAGRILFVALEKRFAGQGAQAAAALCGWSPLSGVKSIVLVDDDVDLRDPARVWGQVAAEFDPASDLYSLAGPADPLERPDGSPGLGTTIVIDATRKLAGERGSVSRLEPRVSAEILERIERRWDEYGLGAVAKMAARC